MTTASKITAGVIGVVVLAYFAGVIVFSNMFLPNTTLAGRDVSFRTTASVADALEKELDGYSAQVTGDNIDLTITASDVDLKFDADTYISSALRQESPWFWPIGVFLHHSINADELATLDESKLEAIVNAAVDKVNETATSPVDATIKFDSDTNTFTVTDEQEGTKLDASKVCEAVKEGLVALDKTITLGNDVYQQPSVKSDDERLTTAAAEANKYLTATIHLSMSGLDAGTIDASQLAQWVTLDDNLNPVLDEAAIAAWGKGDLSSKLDTVATTRTYTRPDGKTVTVSGGTYGWNIDSASLSTKIADAIKAGGETTIEVPTYSTAAQLPDSGGKDWGNRYIDIDLTEQHARMYDDSGALIWETDIVTGDNALGYNTPTGVYYINSNYNKSNPASMLIGATDPETNEPEYETQVYYWMPFVGNSIGLHDAYWRSSFGGSIYLTDGSHGCVNLPSEKASALNDLIKVGDVVVVHN